MPSETTTPTSLVAEATTVLERGGFQRIEPSFDARWPSMPARIFEDPYCIVALLVFDTWAELRDTWADAQGALAELISASIQQREPKAWDGYLALLTPAEAGVQHAEVDRIRYDVTRVRKLVGTGEDLATLDDVNRILLPVLPFAPVLPESAPRAAIDLIPGILEAKGTPLPIAQALVDAFSRHEPLVEALHREISDDETS